MPILQIEHRVRDYDAWKRAFDGDPVGRAQGGVRRHRVVRGVDDPDLVAIELEFDEVGAAEDFQRLLEQLWGRVGSDLGLTERRMRIVETTESNDY
jgi:hypothetical protein